MPGSQPLKFVENQPSLFELLPSHSMLWRTRWRTRWRVKKGTKFAKFTPT